MRYIIFILAICISSTCPAQTDSLPPDLPKTQSVDDLMRKQFAEQDSISKEQQKQTQETGQKAIEESSEKAIELIRENDKEKSEGINKYIIIGVALLAGIVAVIVQSRKKTDKPVEK